MGRRGAWVWGAGGLLLWLVAVTAFGAGPAVPPERALYRDVRGRVVDGETGEPMPGVPVSLLYEVTTTDCDGRFVFEKVPLTHTAQVSLRVRSKSGLIIGCVTVDVPVRFYPVAASEGEKFDIVIADPREDEELELRLEPLPSSEVDRYCTACHDTNPCLETATYEDVVKTGKDLRGIVVPEDQVEEYKEKLMMLGLRKQTYRKIRYQDTHPDGMNMEIIPKLDLAEYKGAYRKPEGLYLLDDKYVTCDTCHTRHMPTDQKQYVVMSYEEDSELCLKCHL
ncbi:MAG: carboxypeptidase-like regulatory domain-containing protein [Deltaproteobacteria bacterium]|nr:carboxypeptidase-like regulatory domain-containing protein [Deltaproteobacteria bacterium]